MSTRSAQAMGVGVNHHGRPERVMPCDQETAALAREVAGLRRLGPDTTVSGNQRTTNKRIKAFLLEMGIDTAYRPVSLLPYGQGGSVGRPFTPQFVLEPYFVGTHPNERGIALKAVSPRKITRQYLEELKIVGDSYKLHIVLISARPQEHLESDLAAQMARRHAMEEEAQAPGVRLTDHVGAYWVSRNTPAGNGELRGELEALVNRAKRGGNTVNRLVAYATVLNKRFLLRDSEGRPQ